MERLTERERRVYESMQGMVKEKGYPPTLKEICAMAGIKSANTAHSLVKSIERKGWIKKEPGKPRGISFTDRSFDPHMSGVDLPLSDFVNVPELGMFGNYRYDYDKGEDVYDYRQLGFFPVLADHAKDGDFVVTIDTLDIGRTKPEGIMIGDKVLVRKADVDGYGGDDPLDGRSVAALIPHNGFFAPTVFPDWGVYQGYISVGLKETFLGAVEAVFRLHQ